jgi:tellurite resistance protein TerC
MPSNTMMFAFIEITVWHWVAFICCLVIFLALDVGVFHRKAHTIKFSEAFAWTALWFLLAVLFALGLRAYRSEKEALEFFTGYILELSLSMDNVFVIALIFAYFGIPREHQHRVLFWGILGAIAMRGAIIGVGVALVSMISWVLYVLGIFLVYTGVKMVFSKTEVHPENNRVLRLARKLYPVTPHLDGQKFITIWEGKRALTPLALVLLMVETTDLIFAVDSIPAVFAVTTNAFIVFTSNMFAVLGLRSLYFVLAGAIGYFRYLNIGLSVVLVFIGAKMLLDPHEHEAKWFQIEIPISISLTIVGGIILASILFSLLAALWEKRNRRLKARDMA